MTAATTSTGRVPRRAFRRLVVTEARLAWRQPIGLVWGVGLPVVMLIIFGSIPAFQEPIPGAGGLTILDAYVPVLIVLVLSMLAFMSLPYPLAHYRELGVLRRMSATPVAPSRLLAAQVVVNLAMAATALLLIGVVGGVAFHLRPPVHVPGLALTLLLSTACLFSLGLCVAAFARTGGVAAALGNVLFFPLAFFAGLWYPQQEMPDALRSISQATPTGAAVQALNEALAGQVPSLSPLLVLTGYTIVFAAVATRWFRWA